MRLEFVPWLSQVCWTVPWNSVIMCALKWVFAWTSKSALAREIAWFTIRSLRPGSPSSITSTRRLIAKTKTVKKEWIKEQSFDLCVPYVTRQQQQQRVRLGSYLNSITYFEMYIKWFHRTQNSKQYHGTFINDVTWPGCGGADHSCDRHDSWTIKGKCLWDV